MAGSSISVLLVEDNPDDVDLTQEALEDIDIETELTVAEDGVEALVHYPTPLHLQPAAKSLGYTEVDFPVTMEASARILSLPLYPGLTHSQQDRVVDLFAEFYKGNGE